MKTTLYIVGAGFSKHAGLPLQRDFTESLLHVGTPDPQQEILVRFLREFVHTAFDHNITARSRHWPELEDIFTCIDLSANTGHNLGADCEASFLRTVRRALISRMIRMLDDRYLDASKRMDDDWRQLAKFFDAVTLGRSRFISLNWDTVIERGIRQVSPTTNFEYGSEADAVDFNGNNLVPVKLGRTNIPIVKIHGSVNWLYCDNCRRLFWFPPDKSREISNRMLGEKDWPVIHKSNVPPLAQSLCRHCRRVSLSTRLATFSYLKALDFPMFQRSWLFAEKLLHESDRWVFIGYSLPAADFEFKYLLKRVQLSRNRRPEFILVTNGKPDEAEATYAKYQRFFGRSMKRDFLDGLTDKAITTIS